MSPLADLRSGFRDPGRQSQSVFRSAMDAMARPAAISELRVDIDPPDPLLPSAAAILLALADFETTVWLDGPLSRVAGVREFVTFHTGARLIDECDNAAFAVVSAPLAMPPLSAFAQGTAEYPDRSTTIIAQVERLAPEGLMLSGPGIKNTACISGSPLPEDFPAQLEINRRRFPCGVDLFLISPTHMAALPRSVRIISES